MLSFAVIDDHPLVRSSLSTILSSDFKNCTVSCFANAKDLINVYKESSFDLLLVDLSLPDMNGFECIAEIKKMNQKQKIIAISAFALEFTIQKAMIAGSNSFLCKAAEVFEIVDCIKEVLKKGNYASKWILDLKESPSNKLSKIILTKQEKDVFKLMASDLTYHQIAKSLNISASTVDYHRKKLFEITGAKSRARLAQLAVAFFFWETQELIR
jgi:DNA-binding NarL/FixJ family response regulator